ncbi:MAG: FYVE zinc finger domain-containing protein [Thermoplasmata archaeon]
MDPSLAASIVVRNKNNVWISDNMVTKCHTCKKEFSILLRRHHCRNCGNIFCYKCSNYFIVIPDFIIDKPDREYYWNILRYIPSFGNKKERVCKQCYDLINEKIRGYGQIVKMFDNPLPIDKIKELPETNADVKFHYFDHLRNIQYYLPNHKYIDIDKKILKINATNLSKHSKYLVHYLKSIDWNLCSQQDLDSIINVINGEKIKDCSELFCTRTCQEYLSCDDCVDILFSCAEKLPEVILRYLFDIIMITPEQVILCHLPFFVNLVKNYGGNEVLRFLVFKLLGQTKKLIYHTYWFLNNAKENAKIQEILNINNFIELFDHELVKKMHQEYMFFVGLVNNLDNVQNYLLNVFDHYKPITLPYEPDIQLTSVDIKNITIKSSHTKPVIITFGTNTSSNIKLLFKRESIMNDVIVLNLMTLCDIILNDTLNTNFGIVVYPIMPITSDSGMIEIIEQAETIHSIISKKKTILQYIVEKNENKKISDVLDRYMYSLVSYTLHSYFLGLGDRHSANIMVTEDGAIFHIDFGFILGSEAYPLTGIEIKLNSSMLDVIGGTDSKRYEIYLELCTQGITVLRKYFNIFFILLAQSKKFSEKYIEKFIMNRFQPRQTDNVLVYELLTVIKNSSNAYIDAIRDFLHYHLQEKTVQHEVGKIIKGAINLVKKNFSNNN